MIRDPQAWLEGHAPEFDLIDQVLQRVLADEGLQCSRMISGSKSYYCEQHPDHTVFFNACIWIRLKATDLRGRLLKRGTYQQVWWGDLDLDVDGPAIQRAADARKEPLYVTRERYSFAGLTEDSFKEDRYGSIKVDEPSGAAR